MTETGLEIVFIDLLLFTGSAGLSSIFNNYRISNLKILKTIKGLTCNLSLDIDLVFREALLSFLSGQYFVKLLLLDFST